MIFIKINTFSILKLELYHSNTFYQATMSFILARFLVHFFSEVTKTKITQQRRVLFNCLTLVTFGLFGCQVTENATNRTYLVKNVL